MKNLITIVALFTSFCTFGQNDLKTKTNSIIIDLSKLDYVKELNFLEKKKTIRKIHQCGALSIELLYAISIKDAKEENKIAVVLINIYHKETKAKMFFSYPETMGHNWEVTEYVQKESQKNDYFYINKREEIEVVEENKQYVLSCLNKITKDNR